MKPTTEFVKNLSSNYMILSMEKGGADSFALKMLVRNKIEELLKMEVKMIDEQKYYYYDITSKQPISEMIEKRPVSFSQLQKIYQKVFRLPDILKEFLLQENSILMNPEFIYVDATLSVIEFCYYPGIDRPLQEQVGEFTEYLMNRVDYRDEQAVLAVYAIYQVSHDKNCTLEKLREIFENQCAKTNQESKGESLKGKKKIRTEIFTENLKDRCNKKPVYNEENGMEKMEENCMETRIKKISPNMMGDFDEKESGIGKREDRTGKRTVKQEDEHKVQSKQGKDKREQNRQKRGETKGNCKEKNKEREKKENKERNQEGNKREDRKMEFPFMEERIENQKEVMKYPVKVYVQAGFILALGLIVLFSVFKTGILDVNGEAEMRRYILAAVCYLAVEGIGFLFIFRKENMCAEIEDDIGYIDWEDDYDVSISEISDLVFDGTGEENYYQDAFLKETGNCLLQKNKKHFDSNMEELEREAAEESEDTETELLVDFRDNSIAYLESEFSGERIYLKKFPFLIGKLKKGTDYVLENNKISRIHAKFDYDEGRYYIEDMGSTNGTGLNEEALPAHDRKVLSDGDRICLADKNFIFHY